MSAKPKSGVGLRKMKTKIIGLILLLAISCGVKALGFGGILVNSYLNEPLDARITLVSIDPAEVDGLRVSLANPEAFQKAGLIRPLQLTRLKFNTLVDASQQVYIHVTTKAGVREPFLDFLLEVAWGENTLLREFTILLDPPSSEIKASQINPTPGNAGQTPKRSAAPQASRKEAASAGSYGPVKRTETLWVIANRVRPDKSVSVEQMMMALLQANPDAFRHGNVNFLQQGAVLDIPDYETITRLNAAEARRAFRQQNKDWKSLKSGSTATAQSGAASQALPSGRSEGGAEAEAGLIEDAAAGDSAKLSVVETGREETATVEAKERLINEEAVVSSENRLSDEIADSKRDLEAVRAINRDLEELQDALELKIEALRKSLLERNRVIDKLEQRLNEVQSESETAEVTEPGADSIVGERQTVAGGVASEIEMGRKQAEEKPPAETVVVEPEQTDWLALAEKYWLQLFVALLLLMVALLLSLLVRRRRSRNSLPDHEAFGSYIDTDGQTATEEHVLIPQATARDQAERENDRLEGDFSPAAGVDVASALTEADIYLAYRRYGPAEELIKQAIATNPENMVLKAKLLEIYAYRKDKNKFVSSMEQFYQPMIARSPEIWAKVVEMGRGIAPDHELIAGAVLSDDDADAMINNLSLGLDDLTEPGSGKRLDP